MVWTVDSKIEQMNDGANAIASFPKPIITEGSPKYYFTWERAWVRRRNPCVMHQVVTKRLIMQSDVNNDGFQSLP